MTNTSTLQALFTEDVYLLSTRVLVVIPTSWHTLADDHRELLSKILGSVKIGLAGVQIIEAATFNLDTVRQYRPRYVISFGSSFDASRSKYEMLTIDETQVLLADNLHELDDTRKKNLWNVLKLMFNI